VRRVGSSSAQNSGAITPTLDSLTSGKFAGCIEQDRDASKLPPDDLKSIRTLRTWMAAQIASLNKQR
jgi:predicted amidohydrolase YtcJ